jgi:TatA/E family protein of Tat protein translocase
MFGSIGFQELLIILTIALLIFGPKKLPEVGKSIGKAMREFRRTSDEIKEKIEEEIRAEDFREIKKDIEQTVDIAGRSESTSDNPYDFPEEPQKAESPDKDDDGKDTEPHGEGKKVTG